MSDGKLIRLDDAISAVNDNIWWNESEKAAIRLLLRNVPTVEAEEVVHGYWKSAKHVRAMPAETDVVKVVRCQYCENWKGPWLEDQRLGCCQLGKTQLTKPNHFCGFGVRREL